MVLFTRKVHRKLGGNFIFLILTERDDLDTQIYKTFAGCGAVDNDRDPCRASSGEHLAQLLAQHKSHVFSLIQKFNKNVVDGEAYSRRDDLIVITDEAHRTQYGTLTLNMRNALPNASYIGFTGTPLFKDDEITRRVFGDYVSTYDFQRAVEYNENDETRKRFEVMCRAVFSKFKACITIEGVNDCRSDFDTINIVYKSLQQNREQADIIDIIRQLHQVVDEAQTQPADA